MTTHFGFTLMRGKKWPSGPNCSCSVGLIARDDKGAVMFGGAKSIQATDCPELAEAEGVHWAVQMCKELDISNVEMESVV